MDHKTLLRRIEIYAKQKRLSEKTVSRKLFNDGKTVDRLKNGGFLLPPTYQRADEALTALEKEIGIGALVLDEGDGAATKTSEAY